MSNKHYICTGTCGGVSDKAKSCDAVDCPMHGKPLTECGCKDGKHIGMRKKESEEKSGK